MMNQSQEQVLLSDADLETITGGASINYDDFVGTTVMYLDVTEFARYEPSFAGGVWVAAGDING